MFRKKPRRSSKKPAADAAPATPAPAATGEPALPPLPEMPFPHRNFLRDNPMTDEESDGSGDDSEARVMAENAREKVMEVAQMVSLVATLVSAQLPVVKKLLADNRHVMVDVVNAVMENIVEVCYSIDPKDKFSQLKAVCRKAQLDAYLDQGFTRDEAMRFLLASAAPSSDGLAKVATAALNKLNDKDS